MSIRDTREARRLIQSMAPEGEFLAFINEREAQMLRDAGGSGIMTLAGIPSFVEYGDISGATASQSQVDSFSGGDDGSNIVDEVALTRGPTVVTGPDQEEDNIRMMQALGILPGVTFSGTDNILDRRTPRNVGDVAVNFGLFKLAQKYPQVFLAAQAGKSIKNIYDLYKNPDLGLDLNRREETELGVLKTKKENADTYGPLSPKEQERLEELEQKKAEEKK